MNDPPTFWKVRGFKQHSTTQQASLAARTDAINQHIHVDTRLNNGSDKYE